jgi:hypothetical protein
MEGGGGQAQNCLASPARISMMGATAANHVDPMRFLPTVLLAHLALVGPGLAAPGDASRPSETEPSPNTLTRQEKQLGWRLLWDGKSAAGWRSPKSDEFPEKSWVIKNGELTVAASGNAEAAAGGDIITRERFSNFELKVDFKLSPGCNSGIKYFVHPNLDPVTGTGTKAAVGSAIGYEYQLLDDARHPDAKLGRNGNRTLGSLYDLLPATSAKKPNPVGEWNTALIVVQGDHLEHWLNGEKILVCDRNSPEFRDAFAHSKFQNIAEFPQWRDGHILLQEHGSQVSFRNIKFRTLPAD